MGCDVKTIYIAWRNPVRNSWRVVAKVSYNKEESLFFLRYTLGASDPDFPTFPLMKDKDLAYYSNKLFPFLSNRVMPRSRPDIDSYLRWLDVEEYSALDILIASGGGRETDGLEVFTLPNRSHEEKFTVDFFVHGLRYLPSEVVGLVSGLKEGDRLYPMLDVDNDYDKSAIAIRSEQPPFMIGYFPRYLSPVVAQIYSGGKCLNGSLVISRVNVDAPLSMRLRCNFSSSWPKDFSPNYGEDFEDYPSNGEGLTL